MQGAVANMTLAVRVAAPAKRISARATGFSRGAAVRVAPRAAVVRARRVESLRVVAADIDVDKIVATATEAFESAPNKPVLIAYGVASLVALYVVETIVHWPILNVLLGFPLELLGVTTCGALALRYVKEGEDPLKDLSALGSSLKDVLPGLKN